MLIVYILCVLFTSVACFDGALGGGASASAGRAGGMSRAVRSAAPPVGPGSMSRGVRSAVGPVGPGRPFAHCGCPSFSLLGRCRMGVGRVGRRRREAGGGHVVRMLNGFKVRVGAVRTSMNPTVALCRVRLTSNVLLSGIGRFRSSVTLDLSTFKAHIVTPFPNGRAFKVRVPGSCPSIMDVRDILGSSRFGSAQVRLPLTVKGGVSKRMFVVSLSVTPRLLVTNSALRGSSLKLSTVVFSLLCGGRPGRLGLMLVSLNGIRLGICSEVTGGFVTTVPSSRTVIAGAGGTVLALGDVYRIIGSHGGLFRGTKTCGVGRCGRVCVGHELQLISKRRCLPCVIIMVGRFDSLVVACKGRTRSLVIGVTGGTYAINVRVMVAAHHPSGDIIASTIGSDVPRHVTFEVILGDRSRVVLKRPSTGHLTKEKSVFYVRGGRLMQIRYTFISAARVRHVGRCVYRRPNPVRPVRLPRPTGSRKDANKGNDVDTNSLSPFFRGTTRTVILSRRNSADVVRHEFYVNCGHTKQLVSRLRVRNVIKPTRNDGPHRIRIGDVSRLGLGLTGLTGRPRDAVRRATPVGRLLSTRAHASRGRVVRRSLRGGNFYRGSRKGRTIRILGSVSTLGSLVKLTSMGRRLSSVIGFVGLGEGEARRKLPMARVTCRYIFAKGPNAKGAAITELLTKVFGRLKMLGGNRLMRASESKLITRCVKRATIGAGGVVSATLSKILFVSRTCALTRNKDRSCKRRTVTALLGHVRSGESELVMILTKCNSRVGAFVRSGPKLESHFGECVGFPSCAPGRLLRVFRDCLIGRRCMLSRSTLARATGFLAGRINGNGGSFKGTHFMEGLFRGTVARRTGHLTGVRDYSGSVLGHVRRRSVVGDVRQVWSCWARGRRQERV